MSDRELGYALLEVGGIQKYILSTGKLKEMIGGSEIVAALSSNFLDEICQKCELKIIKASEAHCPGEDEVLLLQANAGTIHALCGSPENARKLVGCFGEAALARFPGLPLYAAVRSCSYTRQSVSEGRRDLAGFITKRRNRFPPDDGPVMQSPFRAATLDGRPACAMDRSGSGEAEYISVVSAAKRQPELLESARRRLQNLGEAAFDDKLLVWPQDLTELAGREASGGHGEKIAFIHMDGNDLGVMFRHELEVQEGKSGTGENSDGDYSQFVKEMGQLSQNVADSGNDAFKEAALAVIEYERNSGLAVIDGEGRLVMPLRPLVLGGDDVTLVCRADISLLFINRFIRAFERISKENGHRLTMGAGMVVCAPGYPFLKAFERCEELTDNAKHATAGRDPALRCSSLDYVVITNESELSLERLRQHSFTAKDKSLLTGRPFIFNRPAALSDVVRDAHAVLNELPRSQVRGAIEQCRIGRKEAQKSYEQILHNVSRRMGGRSGGGLMNNEDFKKIFPGSFFHEGGEGEPDFTLLGDFLELSHVLPALGDKRLYRLYLNIMESRSAWDDGNEQEEE